MMLHGIDFSGADGGGAAKIRIVERDLTGGGPATSRGRADRATLLRRIRESRTDGRSHLWRIDAPFSLPIETLDTCGVSHDWRTMAEWMREFGSPRGWRHDLRQASRREPKRECDRAERTPMAPMNLRVFKQTWTLICEVLLPLAGEGVRIEPIANIETPSQVVVCEGCPASVLHRCGWPTKGYKGRGEPPQRVRADIARRLVHEGLALDEATLREATLDEEGDLLDALLLLLPPLQLAVPAEARIEAWVY